MTVIQRKSLKFICSSLIVLCALSPFTILADKPVKADSLESLLKISEGTSKIEILNQLSFILSTVDPKRGINYGEQAYELAVQTNDENLKAEALENIGRGYFSTYDFLKAAEYLTNSLNIYQSLHNGDKIAVITQNIGLAYMQASEFDQAELFILKASEQFIKNNNQSRLAYCYINLGLVSYMKCDYAAALEYYESASVIYKAINEPDHYSELLNRIGMTYWSLGINDKALKYMIESNQLKSKDNPKSLAIGYNNIGAIYKDLGEFDKALEYYMKALTSYREAGDSLDMPSSLSNIGTIYSAKDDPDKAQSYYEDALKISMAVGDKLQTAKTKYNIACICLDKGQYDQAKEYFREYLELSREIGYKEGIAYALLGLSQVSEKEGNSIEARRQLSGCIAVADSIQALQVLKTAHLHMAKILEAKDEYKLALLHFQEYTKIKDTLFNTEKARTISEMETRYETVKKQQENDLLRKDNELKDRRIKTLYLVFGAFAILAVAVILLIFQFRKAAVNKKKLAESEAARLVEKVEHQNRELASSALALSRNFSFINKLVSDLKALSTHTDDEGMSAIMSATRNIQHLGTGSAWKEFEMRFQEVHTKFYENLRNAYPTMTSNEVRLCAFLKLGMSTKEISAFTFQNIRAIETSRLRLRKKLELDGSQDLYAFLQKF
jgi:tetratricopeptide (TPR) repeat protein